MKHGTVIAALVAVFGLSAPVLAEDAPAGSEAAVEETALVGDITAGERRYRRECRHCHGPTGQGLSSYPALTGHSAAFLTDQLERYRAGEQVGPNTALMAPNARRLKDQDIADLVAFIVSLNES